MEIEVLVAGVIMTVWTIGTLLFVFWKDNPLFRITEVSGVALFGGYTAILCYGVLVNYYNQIIGGVKTPLLLLAFPVGALVLATLYRPYRWLIRYPLMFLIGTGSGLALRGALVADFYGQIRGIIEKPLVSFDNIVFVACALTSMFVFIYSVNVKRENRWVNGLMRLGRISLMFYVGANFASTVQFRITHLMDVLRWIFWNFLGLQPYTLPV